VSIFRKLVHAPCWFRLSANREDRSIVRPRCKLIDRIIIEAGSVRDPKTTAGRSEKIAKLRGIFVCTHRVNLVVRGEGTGQRSGPEGLFISGTGRLVHAKLFNGPPSQWDGGLHLLDPRRNA